MRRRRHIRKMIHSIAPTRVPGQVWVGMPGKMTYVLLDYRMSNTATNPNQERIWRVLQRYPSPGELGRHHATGAIEICEHYADEWKNDDAFKCVFSPGGRDT